MNYSKLDLRHIVSWSSWSNVGLKPTFNESVTVGGRWVRKILTRNVMNGFKKD